MCNSPCSIIILPDRDIFPSNFDRNDDIVPLGNMIKLTSTQALGAAIRLARKRAGLRQDELAGAAGVGIRFIVELEAGKPTLQLGKALAVLAALGHSLHIDTETP